MWCGLISDGVCLRRSTQSWWRRCSPIRGMPWSTSGWRTRSTTSLPAARLQPWTANRRWPSSRAWRSLLPMWGGFCVSNKPLPPATVHSSFPSPPPLPLREAFHHAKPWRCSAQHRLRRLWAFRHTCPPERGERPAKAERGRPVGHDHLSLIWSLFTLPLRGPQMNIYEVQRGNLSENWSLHPPFTHTHTRCLLQTLLLECLRIWFITAQIQLCLQRQ